MNDTMTLPSEPALSAEQAYQQALQQTLQLAVSLQGAGQMQTAGQVYRAILQAEPEHPQANHNLGMLLVHMQQPAAGLPHFEAALAAKPESERYWLSYIDALEQDGQTELARQMLAFGRQHGLEGDAVEALAEILNAGQRAGHLAGAEQQRSV
jgi:uncharacterized protein HemY